jgi:amino acid transporter
MGWNQLFRKKSIEHILTTHAHQAEGQVLHRTLTLRDLTAFGIAAIIGSGIFSTIGTALADGGPAVSLLYIFTAFACAMSAMCYAEFASRIPVAGSAYTYSYASFGEIIAWIIGWDLLMEYAVGNIAVAISWSDYFTSFVQNAFNWHIPSWLTTDWITAESRYNEGAKFIADGNCACKLTGNIKEGYEAWLTAPDLGFTHLVVDLPAFLITILITWLVYRGIQESRRAGNMMVLIKLVAILFVVGVGAAFVNVEHWSPFAPNGIGGVLKGVSGVFFAYIGFDAISTTAEECKNPQKDLPRSMFLSLGICTVIYVLVSLVLTGMVDYKELGVGDPLSYVFDVVGLKYISIIISASAVIAIASVLLVFQMGQPRIWMSMSRDGLLPPIFSKIHPKFQTPSFSTILTGVIVGVPALFVTLGIVTDLTSIGTLFAFMLVCGGILVLEERKETSKALYKVPYVNGKYIVPIIFVLGFYLAYYFATEKFLAFFTYGEWDAFKLKIPMWGFIIMATYITYRTYIKNYSLIPVLGLLSNGYLISELGWINWIGFTIWLVIGLIIYFVYGYHKSKLKSIGESVSS